MKTRFSGLFFLQSDSRVIFPKLRRAWAVHSPCYSSEWHLTPEPRLLPTRSWLVHFPCYSSEWCLAPEPHVLFSFLPLAKGHMIWQWIALCQAVMTSSEHGAETEEHLCPRAQSAGLGLTVPLLCLLLSANWFSWLLLLFEGSILDRSLLSLQDSFNVSKTVLKSWTVRLLTILEISRLTEALFLQSQVKIESQVKIDSHLLRFSTCPLLVSEQHSICFVCHPNLWLVPVLFAKIILFRAEKAQMPRYIWRKNYLPQ